MKDLELGVNSVETGHNYWIKAQLKIVKALPHLELESLRNCLFPYEMAYAWMVSGSREELLATTHWPSIGQSCSPCFPYLDSQLAGEESFLLIGVYHSWLELCQSAIWLHYLQSAIWLKLDLYLLLCLEASSQETFLNFNCKNHVYEADKGSLEDYWQGWGRPKTHRIPNKQNC